MPLGREEKLTPSLSRKERPRERRMKLLLRRREKQILSPNFHPLSQAFLKTPNLARIGAVRLRTRPVLKELLEPQQIVTAADRKSGSLVRVSDPLTKIMKRQPKRREMLMLSPSKRKEKLKPSLSSKERKPLGRVERPKLRLTLTRLLKPKLALPRLRLTLPKPRLTLPRPRLTPKMLP